MNNAIWAMLNSSEQALLRQTEAAALGGLDEDDLIDLHTRVRRARTKYTTLYRRRASAQVTRDATRAKAHEQHARTAVKAEAFETALARVSQALAKAARARASELRAERLDAARRDGRPSRPASRKPRTTPSKGVRAGATRRRTPMSERASAQARAATRRAQASRETH